MIELTDERKEELRCNLEYTVNRYLDKKDIVGESMDLIAKTDEELEYINTLACSFVVEREDG